MKKIIFFTMIISVLIIISCQQPEKPVKYGSIPLFISLEPAFDNGYNVTRVEAIISKDDFTKTLNLTIKADSARGEFEHLEPGTYLITINIYENDTLIATGSSTAEVHAGETTTVHITIHFVQETGNLEIIVNWITDKNLPDSLLFIGNSYTFVNGGLDILLKRFAESAHPDWTINTTKISYGNYTLEDHYHNPTSLATIRSGRYDYVILQEEGLRPIDEPDSMFYYAELLNGVIDSVGAKTVFFMTWAKKDQPETIGKIKNAYEYISDKLGAYLVPVGIAFDKAKQIAPNIELYSADQDHPSPYGTYLTVCTFYSFLYDETPVGVQYCNVDTISATDKQSLQEIAWETYLDYSKR